MIYLLLYQIHTACFLILLVLFPALVKAGSIEFKDFKIIGQPEKYQVYTRVEFELTNSLRDALLNGVTLKARVQFRLGEHRSWWFNKDTTLLTVHYQLTYQALSQHYLLSRRDTGESWNYSTLPAILRKLGELRKYNLPPISEPLKNGDYYLFAIADIAPTTLELPLRFQSLFTNKYELTSEGILWPLP